MFSLKNTKGPVMVNENRMPMPFLLVIGLACVLVGSTACGGKRNVQPTGQSRLDANTDSADGGGTDAAGDIARDGTTADRGLDASDLDAFDEWEDCVPNAHRDGSDCVCDDGYFESDEGWCLVCLDNSHCDGRVCAANACRNCMSHDECGPDLFCGEEGQCTDVAPPCTTEGERRCQNHRVQYCEDDTWADDTSGECPFGCDDDTDDCYDDTNVGWIGGRCNAVDDCTRVADVSAQCLPPEEGFAAGSCTQTCVSTCPDQYEDTDTVTFCVDSEGLTSGGFCVSKCDFDLFSDTGCRPGYECRAMARHRNPGIVQSVCLPINWYRNPSRRFDYGITAGEVTPTTAIVWTHTGEVETDVVVSYGTDPDSLDQTAEGMSTEELGFTVQVELVGMTPDTDYYYQFSLDGLVDSSVGRLHTAPQASASVPVKFMFSADVEKNKPSLLGILDEMRSFDVDFFLNLGDWPIADSANTLEEYRAVYHMDRQYEQIHTFLQRFSMYSIFDDHEVYNDWDASYRAANPDSVDNGLRVWSEWWPLRRVAPGEFYRSYRWGDLEFFFLDARTHRDPRGDEDGPTKTMLGETQREWLLDELRESNAVFKIILTSVPLDFGTTGTDSWMGYTYERDLIWDAITDQGIDGVVFLAADQHWFSAHHHNSGFKEIMSCPINRMLRSPPSAPNAHIVHTLKDYNFSVVTYDPADGGTLLVESYNDDRDLFFSEEIRSGRGRIEVTADTLAPFTICPPDLIGPDCTHVFDGVAPTTFEYAVPGPYTIRWEPRPGLLVPPSESGVLTDGGTLSFHGEYGGMSLPFSDSFDGELYWVVVDDGNISAPSDWVLTTDEHGDGVLEQTSNIYSGTPDGEGPIDKLGTLVFNGDPDWDDYTVSVDFRASDDDSVGVIARYLNNDNYYRFSLDRQRTFARLVARVDGAFYLLASDSDYPGYDEDTWTEISLSVDGNSIEAYVGADLVLSATDGRVATGAVGLYVWGVEGVQFDDVTVE